MHVDQSETKDVLLTRARARRVDQIAMDIYGIPGMVLMENAARNASELIYERFNNEVKDATPSILIACGGGNNGGDGYAIARHLHNRGVRVVILAVVPAEKLDGDAAINCEIARRMQLPLLAWPSTEADALLDSAPAMVVDALLGTGFSGDVRAPMDRLIARLNDLDALRIAIDVPSGLDCDTGAPSNATIRADLTITFVARKIGFAQTRALGYLGNVEVVDIGAPPEIVNRVLRE